MRKKKSLTRDYIETVGEVYKEKGLFAAIGYELNSTLHSISSRINNTFDSLTLHTTQDGTYGGPGGWPKGSLGANEYSYAMGKIRDRAEGRHRFLLRQKKARALPGEEERVELRHKGPYVYNVVLHKPDGEEEELASIGINNLGHHNNPWNVNEYIHGHPDSDVQYTNIKSKGEADLIALKQANKIAKRLARQRSLPLEHLVIEDMEAQEDAALAKQIDSLQLKRISSIILFFGGLTLSFFSLKSTGNAIGNLTGTFQGLLGLILFVVGLAGLVFSLGKK